MGQIDPREIIDKKILKICEFTKLAQVGIDLTMSEALNIPNNSARNILLNEKIHLPENVFALLVHRSTFNRSGVQIIGSVYDPNYNGQIGCTVYNFSGSLFKINQNERVCQMLFFEAKPASLYSGKYQGEYL